MHSVDAIVESLPLRGDWTDRTALYAARQSREVVVDDDYVSELTLRLETLPCWSHLDGARYRHRVREMVIEIERQTIARHRREGTVPAGAAWVRRRHPHERPEARDRGSARPRFHTYRKRMGRVLLEGYRLFLAAYRAAARRLSAGEVGIRFPPNCFQPRLPFVPPARLEPG